AEAHPRRHKQERECPRPRRAGCLGIPGLSASRLHWGLKVTCLSAAGRANVRIGFDWIRPCIEHAIGARAVAARSSRNEAFVGAATGDRSRSGRKAPFSKHALRPCIPKLLAAFALKPTGPLIGRSA